MTDLVDLSGLSEETILVELSQAIKKIEASPDKLGIEELRAVMLSYLEEVFEDGNIIDDQPSDSIQNE